MSKFVFLHENASIIVSTFSATITTSTNNENTTAGTTTVVNQTTGNTGTPSPKPGTPSNPSGDLTVLTPVQPSISQEYTPLPSFPTQFSSKHYFTQHSWVKWIAPHSVSK